MKRPALVEVTLVRGLSAWIIGDLDAEVLGPEAIARDRGLADSLMLVGALNTYWGFPIALVASFFLRIRRPPRPA